jgi:hypothetical protein
MSEQEVLALLGTLTAELSVISAFVAELLARDCRSTGNAPDALRTVSENVQSLIDQMPFGPGMGRGNDMVEIARHRADIIVLAAQKRLAAG